MAEAPWDYASLDGLNDVYGPCVSEEGPTCDAMRQKLNNRLDHLRKEQSVLASSAADVQGQINQLQGQWIMIRDKHKEVSAQIAVLEEMAAEPGEDES